MSVCLVFVAAPSLTRADLDLPTPDVVDCLKAIEPLDLRYRGWMQQHCVVVAGDICIAVDKGTGSCLSDVVASMRTFYEELLPLLPPTIEGNGYAPKGYERALERAVDTFENVPECSGLNGYELTTCEYVQLGVATLDLFYRARLANVSLP